jgi:poly(hydroxyalkanoate) depolymerase family esterase
MNSSVRVATGFKSGFLFLLLLLASSAGRAQKIQRIKTFGSNPGHLYMYYYAGGGSTSTPRPLVLVLHGCLQNAKQVAVQTGWNTLAKKYGFDVLYPEQEFLNNPAKCFCWYDGRNINKGKGEDESIREMIAWAKAHYAVDSSRIFITGLSAGAAMTLVLMATDPHVFNTGAVFAGAPYKLGIGALTGVVHKPAAVWGGLVRQQNPDYTGTYPKLIIYQGESDPIVNKGYALEIVKQWSSLVGTDTLPGITLSNFAGNERIDKLLYSDKAGIPQIGYYKIRKMGHALPVDPGKCEEQGGKLKRFSVDMDYHSTYWTAVDFGLIKKDSISGKTSIASAEKNLTYTVPFHERSTYQWTLPSGCVLIPGAAGNAITVDWGNASGCINVTETNASGCRNAFPTLFVKVGDVSH